MSISANIKAKIDQYVPTKKGRASALKKAEEIKTRGMTDDTLWEAIKKSIKADGKGEKK